MATAQWLMLALFISFSTMAASPSYECSKANASVETLICNDDELAALDRQLAKVYRQALQSLPAEKQLRAMQRGWIKGRNDCWKAADVRQCTAYNYQSRIIELQIQAGLLKATSRAVFDCGEFVDVSADFYTQLNPVTAVFSFDGQQLIASAVVSASGAKYQGKNFEFWQHHGEARLRYLERSAACLLQK